MVLAADDAVRHAAWSGAGNKATARTLAVLGVFCDGAASHGVTDIGRALGMTKSMVYRALMTLVEQGLLVRDPSGARYQLGPGVLELSPLDVPQPKLQDVVRPFMRELHEISGETVSLGVPSGRDVLTLDGIEGRASIAQRVPIGRRVPLHATAAGRSILAYAGDGEIARYLVDPLQRFTDTTLTTPGELWEEVVLVRSRGYAMIYGDHSPHSGGISFPLLDCEQRALGSVTVSGPRERLTPDRIRALLPSLQRVCAELGRHTRLLRRAVIDHGPA